MNIGEYVDTFSLTKHIWRLQNKADHLSNQTTRIRLGVSYESMQHFVG